MRDLRLFVIGAALGALLSAMLAAGVLFTMILSASALAFTAWVPMSTVPLVTPAAAMAVLTAR